MHDLADMLMFCLLNPPGTLPHGVVMRLAYDVWQDSCQLGWYGGDVKLCWGVNEKARGASWHAANGG